MNLLIALLAALALYLLVSGLYELPAKLRERRLRKFMESDWRKQWHR